MKKQHDSADTRIFTGTYCTARKPHNTTQIQTEAMGLNENMAVEHCAKLNENLKPDHTYYWEVLKT